MALVLMDCSWVARISPSVSFFKIPFVSHSHVFSLSIWLSIFPRSCPWRAFVHQFSLLLWIVFLRYPELATVCKNSNTLILYPGAGATNLEEININSSDPCVIIIIDGTWSQAKDIFFKNSLFRIPKQVELKTSLSSQYVIRTQPTNTCLSTLECAAVALAIMEKNESIKETVLRPLQALCSFQLQHGAQVHHSKEHLLKNGLYDKPMPKNKRKLRRMELLVNNVKI
ncbi:tRNA-uridine aminocarboxypropyltransferase 2 isoform X2 [Anolis carolinensis]|uniref:tRNA-uridine aminocarboxypropyltransferase 2 isoform X2 n=1 Tax=Anolis carolinensis TaxID=28377 RepID=UPI002F2B2A91